MAVVSMLVVDLAGHIALHVEQKPNVMCMFVQPIPLHDSEYKTLNLHWAILILPNLLIGIAPKLVMAIYMSRVYISTDSSFNDGCNDWHALCYQRPFSTSKCYLSGLIFS